MIRFKIHFESIVERSLYEDYCKFIYESVQRTVKELIDPKKYRVREKLILESSVIKWEGHPPKHIDLAYYVENCLTMTKEDGEYVIHLDDYKVVTGSRTQVSTLVRLLEYGNEKIPPYPVVRRVMYYYYLKYPRLILQFMKARMMKRESVSVRRSTRRKTTKGFRR